MTRRKPAPKPPPVPAAWLRQQIEAELQMRRELMALWRESLVPIDLLTKRLKVKRYEAANGLDEALAALPKQMTADPEGPTT